MTASSETNTRHNNLGVIMHLKNAAAFKYEKKETFYDSFDVVRLVMKRRRKLRAIVLSRSEKKKGK